MSKSWNCKLSDEALDTLSEYDQYCVGDLAYAYLDSVDVLLSTIPAEDAEAIREEMKYENIVCDMPDYSAYVKGYVFSDAAKELVFKMNWHYVSDTRAGFEIPEDKLPPVDYKILRWIQSGTELSLCQACGVARLPELDESTLATLKSWGFESPETLLEMYTPTYEYYVARLSESAQEALKDVRHGVPLATTTLEMRRMLPLCWLTADIHDYVMADVDCYPSEFETYSPIEQEILTYYDYWFQQFDKHCMALPIKYYKCVSDGVHLSDNYVHFMTDMSEGKVSRLFEDVTVHTLLRSATCDGDSEVLRDANKDPLPKLPSTLLWSCLSAPDTCIAYLRNYGAKCVAEYANEDDCE